MTSRTPIRLTPHRGPLATPSTSPVASPESSPTSSTPPTDISHYSTASSSVLDVAILQHRISTLNPITRHDFRSRLLRRRREVIERGLYGRSVQLTLAFENLVYSACDFANTLAGIVTFCLFIWGLLEWSLHASGLPPKPNSRLLQLPLPSRASSLPFHANPFRCELRDDRVVVLQFLSEHIQHAKALSSLSTSLGLPLRSFLQAHRATIPRVMVRHGLPELPHAPREASMLANLTEVLDTSILDFSSGSFIGRSLALALDEMGDLISEPMISPGSSIHGRHPDAHLHAIYWRTTSNLLLEYSAARPHAGRLLHHLRVLHQRVSPMLLDQRAIEGVAGRPDMRWWQDIFGHLPTTEDGMKALVTGLEIALDNVQRLVAYLDWITDQLAQTTLADVLEKPRRADFSTCLMSLQELFAQSGPSPPKKRCFCRDAYGSASFSRLEKVEITVPGSRTVRTGR